MNNSNHKVLKEDKKLSREIHISIIIVSYYSLELLENCVQSIIQFNPLGENLEVIIIDNSSIEETKRIKDFVTQLDKVITIKVLFSGGNHGFGAANNLGVKLSEGKLICFLNPDTILIEDIFTQPLIEFEDLNVRTLGVNLVNEDFTPELSFFFVRGYWSPITTPIVLILNKLRLKLPNMITSGACLFIRKKDFQIIKGFSTKMILFHEESYLARKIKNQFPDAKFLYMNDIRLIHLEKKEKISTFKRNEYYRSMVFYYNYFNFNTRVIMFTYFLKNLIRQLFIKKRNAIEPNEYILLKKYMKNG